MSNKRTTISLAKKQEVIKWIECEGEGIPTRAARHFGRLGWSLDPGTVRQWWRHRAILMSASPHRMRLEGGGRRRVLGPLEDDLLDAIIERRIKKEKVTRAWIAAQALHLYGENVEEPIRTFEASHQWVSCFMRRNDLSLRRRTNLTTLSDDQLVERAVSYMRFLGENKASYNPEHTVLMDETAVYFEDAREQTVEVRGARHVVVKATGFASMRVTAAMAVIAAGVKLPPLVIWKHKKGSRLVAKQGAAYVAYQPKAWVDSDLLCNWIDAIFPPVLQADGKAIVWDSMRAHISKKVKAKCASRGISLCVIPGGLTPYLQAGDIGIFKRFKDLLCATIDEWKNSDQVEYTRGGNPRPPSGELVCKWVADAWKETPQLVVNNSIDAAGFHEDPSEWFIWKHDVYGRKFQQRWTAQQTNESAVDDEVIDELSNALDDVEVVDE